MTISRMFDEHARPKKPNVVVASDSKTNSPFEARESLICGRPKKMFFLGLGCKGASMAAAATAPRIVRSAADWRAENEQRKKQGRGNAQIRRTTDRNPVNVDICCTPPGITFSCDVIPSTSPRRAEHATRVARRNRNVNYFSVSTPQRLPNSPLGRAHSIPGGEISEVNANLGRRLEEHWRQNVHSLIYQELLLLSEKIGYAGKGLCEEEILKCLRIFKPADFETGPLLISIDKEWRCSICQEGCRATDSVGRLGCGHCHHIDCIKQWLKLKNECPVCKTEPIADK